MRNATAARRERLCNAPNIRLLCPHDSQRGVPTDFHSLLFVVQVTVNFDLADDTEQRQNRPAIMMKLVLMDIPVFDVPAMMFWSDTITGTAPKEHSQGLLDS